MAKKPVKEAGTALIFATVFFVLTTIAFGVLWYTEMSNVAAEKQKADEATKAKAASDGVLADAKLDYAVARLYFGVGDDEDAKQVTGWGEKEKKRAGETIKKLSQSVVDKVGKGELSNLPPQLTLWGVNASGNPEEPPSESPLASIAKLAAERETAKGDAAKVAAVYEAASAAAKKQEDASRAIAKDLEALVKSLPADYDTKLKAELVKIEERMARFTSDMAGFRKENAGLNDQIQESGHTKARLEREIAALKEQIAALNSRLTTDRTAETFLNDQPHGRITKRLDDGIVEIDIGSDSLVRPGLTFTVLPQDFPEKGRGSRTMVLREPDERGVYRNVERFVEKANIEVIEVLGPKSSRARITKEFDRIRDAAGAGDLIYNAVWRKGAADRIALVGVFDINGDGSDDIETVVRDLTRMGIPVDAYFDMRERKWVGELTQHTRFVVEGWYPVQSAIDPNRDEKTRLIGETTKSVESAQKLGVSPVKFQDFFPRIGYRVKIDTTKDKINQAFAPYLNKVSTEVLPKGGN
jgi:hypothetical protein